MTPDDAEGTVTDQREIYQQLLNRYQSFYRCTRAALEQQRQTIDQLRQESDALGNAGRLLHEPLRQALLLARSCARLEVQIKADAYVAHDERALLAADYMKEKHDGIFVYDAVEAFDIQDKTSAYGQEISLYDQIFYNAMSQAALANTDARFATSDPLANYLARKYGIGFDVLPNYLSGAVATRREPAIREQCGCAASDFLMLYVNNIYLASRFEDILAALSLCESSVKLVCVGKIYPAQYQEKLAEVVREYALAERVHFLPPVPYVQYFDYISGCDGALIWLDDENVNCRLNLHNRYLDAIGAALPVLSSSNDAFAQLNHEYGFGLIASGNNVPTLAKFMASLRERREAFLPGIERARNVLRWERVEAGFAQVFSGCRSVTFITTKDPARNQRLRRQIATLRTRGIAVFGVGSFEGDRVTEELGTWFNLDHTAGSPARRPSPSAELKTRSR